MMPLPARPILFLGAGASAPFGYPPTGPFAQELQDHIPNSTQEGVLLRSIGNVPGVQDAEQILEILDSIVDLEKSPIRRYFENSSLNIPILGGISYRDFAPLVQSLRDQIRREIFNTYSWKRVAEAGFGCYRDLFALLPMLDDPILEVFTTNYDRLIEEFCAAQENIRLVDGFTHVEKRRVWKWNPTIIDTLTTRGLSKEAIVALYKLHGSLNWRRTIDGVIEQVRPEEPIQAGGGSFEENVLIYPGGKTQPILEPFRKLHETFADRMRTATTCLVIGFSFRDEYLNVGFSEFLERRGTMLIVVSPSATKNVEANLVKGRSVELLKDKGKLTMINKPFEEAISNELPRIFGPDKKQR